MITLSAERVQNLVDALAEAFTPEDLDHKIADPLGVPAAERSGARDVRERAAALVRWAAGSRMEELIAAALRGNPSSSQLRAFAESVGLLAASSALVEVVRSVLPADGEKEWLRGLGEAQRQVCGIRIAIRGEAEERRCTGFLVGDDQVMTLQAPVDRLADAHVEFAFEDLTLGIHRKDPVVVAADDVCVLRLERPIARELQQGSAQVAVRGRAGGSHRRGDRGRWRTARFDRAVRRGGSAGRRRGPRSRGERRERAPVPDGDASRIPRRPLLRCVLAPGRDPPRERAGGQPWSHR